MLEAHADIAEIRFSAPNKHHFLYDLSPFGLDNPNEVFHADDRPYGLIQATVTRDDAPARVGPGTPSRLLVTARTEQEMTMEFLQPTTWDEALAAKAEHPRAVPIAGGTDVMVELNFDHRRPTDAARPDQGR